MVVKGQGVEGGGRGDWVQMGSLTRWSHRRGHRSARCCFNWPKLEEAATFTAI